MTRIACSTYSFNQLISKGEISQLESLQLAKEMGFDAIEIVGLIHDESIAERDYVYQLKEELERLNFPIASFTFHANLLHEDAEQTHLEIKRIKKMIDYAEILGAKRIRHDVAWGQSKKSFDIVLPDLALACRTITEYAATSKSSLWWKITDFSFKIVTAWKNFIIKFTILISNYSSMSVTSYV